MSEFFLLQPIIGEVTDTAAKILLEVEHDVDYELTTPNDVHTIISNGSIVTTDTVMTIILQNLNSGQRYILRWYDVLTRKLVYTNRFRTLTSVGPKTIVTVSCDLPEMNRGPLLWERIPDIEPDLVLHLGDNVYMDGTYHRAYLELKVGRELAARELLRERYRQVWGRPETLRVWSNFSNLCIWDDHEINNKYPNRIADKEREVYSLTTQTYAEYQEALRLIPTSIDTTVIASVDPISASLTAPEGILEIEHIEQLEIEQLEIEHIEELEVDGEDDLRTYRGYTRQWGDLLMIVTEFISLRQQSDFVKDRWPNIIREIKESKARRIMLVSPKALLPMSTGLWSHFIEPEFSTEDLNTIYDDLFNWLTEDDVHLKPMTQKRHVLMVMGDLHIGARGTINRTREYVNVSIDFILSTPITNWPFVYESNCIRAMRSSRREIKNWEVIYHSLVDRRNFGVIRISEFGFQTELVVGSGRRPPIRKLIRGIGRLTCA